MASLYDFLTPTSLRQRKLNFPLANIYPKICKI